MSNDVRKVGVVMAMSKGCLLIAAISAFWGLATGLNVFLYRLSFGAPPAPTGVGVAIAGGLLEVVAGLFVLERFATNRAVPQVFRHPDFEPQTAGTHARSSGFRHALPALVGLCLVLAAVTVLMSVQLPSQHDIAAASVDSIDPNPVSHLAGLPDEKGPQGSRDFILHKGVEVDFRASHPNSLKYQWLLHIAGTAELVASAGQGQELSYRLRQLDSDWGGAQSRFEFLVIVTADRVLPGWPESVPPSVKLTDLLNKDSCNRLQLAALRPEGEERNAAIQQVLRKAFDDHFGPNQCWFRVDVYLSENRPAEKRM